MLNSATLGSLINAGVQIAGSAATGAATAGIPALAGGPVAAAAAASAGAAAGATAGLPGLIAPAISILGNTATAALNIIPPQSAEKKVSSIFDLLINEVKANQDLPQILTDSRLWNQQATHGGYHTARVAMDGSTPMDITADWIIAAARDLKNTANAAAAKKNPPPGTTTATTTTSTTAKPAPMVNADYNRDKNGNVINPLQAPPGAAAAAKTDTPGDVRITTNGQTTPQAPTKTTPLTWVADGANSIAARVVATDHQHPGRGPAAHRLSGARGRTRHRQGGRKAMSSIIRRREEPIVRPVIEPFHDDEGQDDDEPATAEQHQPHATGTAATPDPTEHTDEADEEPAPAADQPEAAGRSPLFHIMAAVPESGATTLAAWCECAEEVARDTRWRPPADHSPYLVLTAPKTPEGVRAARQLAGALSHTVGGGAQVAAITLLEDQPRPTSRCAS